MIDLGQTNMGWICGLPYVQKIDQVGLQIELLAAPVVKIRFRTSLHDRLYIVIPDAPLLALTTPNNERSEIAGGKEW